VSSASASSAVYLASKVPTAMDSGNVSWRGPTNWGALSFRSRTRIRTCKI
jgi:hypothetical protein